MYHNIVFLNTRELLRIFGGDWTGRICRVSFEFIQKSSYGLYKYFIVFMLGWGCRRWGCTRTTPFETLYITKNNSINKLNDTKTKISVNSLCSSHQNTRSMLMHCFPLKRKISICYICSSPQKKQKKQKKKVFIF